jgi:hypothetical protein
LIWDEPRYHIDIGSPAESLDHFFADFFRVDIVPEDRHSMSKRRDRFFGT